MSDEQMTLPGVPPLLKEQWREHTAERWKRDDPHGYAECIEQIRSGILNRTVLAGRFKRSRNTIAALIHAEFSVEQLEVIIAKAGLVVAGDSLARQQEVIPDATHKELGALAMASKGSLETSKLARGQANVIQEHRVLVIDSNAMAAKLAEKARRMDSGAGEKGAVGAESAPDALALPAVDMKAAVPPCVDVDSERVMVSSDTIRDTLTGSDGFVSRRGGGGSPENSCPSPISIEGAEIL